MEELDAENVEYDPNDLSTSRPRQRRGGQGRESGAKKRTWDEEINFVGNDGSVTKFLRLELRARFTEEEIDKMHRVHKQLRARGEA